MTTRSRANWVSVLMIAISLIVAGFIFYLHRDAMKNIQALQGIIVQGVMEQIKAEYKVKPEDIQKNATEINSIEQRVEAIEKQIQEQLPTPVSPSDQDNDRPGDE